MWWVSYLSFGHHWQMSFQLCNPSHCILPPPPPPPPPPPLWGLRVSWATSLWLMPHPDLNLYAITHQLQRVIWAAVWGRVTESAAGADTGLQSTLLSSTSHTLTHTHSHTPPPASTMLWRMSPLSAPSSTQSQHALCCHKWPSALTKRVLLFSLSTQSAKTWRMEWSSWHTASGSVGRNRSRRPSFLFFVSNKLK